MSNLQFNEVINFTRGTGATRINAAGLIVGVDFSSTSNTIATGSKTFTLTADANVNRDWAVGSSVIAVSQAGATGSMTGLVTSYSPATQELVIEVASVTGSGTSTNWRIGSLEVRRDPVTGGVVSEGAATNLVFPSDTLTTQTRTVVIGTAYTLSFWGTGSVTLSGAATGTFTGNGAFPATRQTATFVATTASLTLTVTGTVSMAQVESGGSATSYIPTTTTQVTRAADSFALSALSINTLRQGEGTLYAEITCDDTSPAQKRALRLSGSTGDIRLAKRGTGTLSAIQKMATDGVTDIIGLNNSTNNVLRNAGAEYLEVNDGSGTATFGVATNAVGSFLRVGATENIRSTADSGSTFNARTIGGTFGYATFALGRFVIPNTAATINGATVGSVIVSADGLSFRRVNIPGLTQQLIEVTSNGTNQYVAVGGGGVIYTSPDAETWTAQNSGVTTKFNSVTFGAGTYVALNNTPANSRYSVDGGVTWISVTGLTGTPARVIHTGAQFVAINTVGGVFTSANGQAFTAVTTTGITPAFTSALDIEFNNGFYVIVGGNGQIAISQTAANASPATWTTFTSAQTGTTLAFQQVHTFNGKFYASTASQGIIEFTQSLTPTFVSRTANVTAADLFGIASSPTRLLICGGSGAITTSEDGTTFTSRTGSQTNLNGAAFGNGTYVVVGNAVNGSGLIATVDPVTFAYQRRVSGTTQSINNIEFLRGAHYAVGNASVVSRSVDGQSFTTQTIGGTAFNIFDIADNGSTFVAVGSGGRFSTSADGLTFEASALTGVTTQQLNSIAQSNNIFVSVGNAGTIITSPNGTTWTARTSGTTQNLNSVMFSTRDQLWYAAGSGGVILFSGDNAVTWQAVQNSGFAAITNNGLQANPMLPLFKEGINKLAISYGSGGFSAALNGVAISESKTLSVPVITSGVVGENLNGTINIVEHKAQQISTAQLISMTM